MADDLQVLRVSSVFNAKCVECHQAITGSAIRAKRGGESVRLHQECYELRVAGGVDLVTGTD